MSHSLVRVRGNRTAFGQPGTAPRWSPGSKDGVGTAYAASSRLWFTLWNGIVTEVYFPTVDRPQIRVQATDVFRLRWSDDQWQTMRDTIASSTALGVAFVDIVIGPEQQAPIAFTFLWMADDRWEGRNYEARVE